MPSATCPISRVFAQANSDTFSMPPVEKLLRKYIGHGDVIIDPFARNSEWGTYSNDLNPDTKAEYHMDARKFLDVLIEKGVVADVVLFDPPYSPRQIKECYDSVGLPVTMQDTQNAVLYREVKLRLSQLLRHGGVAICFGWNTSGMVDDTLWEWLEITIIRHIGAQNDTLVTVQKKSCPSIESFGGDKDA